MRGDDGDRQGPGKAWEEAVGSWVRAFCLWVSKRESIRPPDRGVFAYIFLALTRMLTSQKERDLSAALTCLFSFPAQLLLPVPCHSTVMPDGHLCAPCSRKGESLLLNSLLNKPLKLQGAVLNPKYPKTDPSAGTSNFSLPKRLSGQLGSRSHWSPTNSHFFFLLGE